MEPLFESEEDYREFEKRQSQYNVATADLSTYEGNCYLGIDAVLPPQRQLSSGKTEPCSILSTATTMAAP
mgnify:CR=1 FL=1